jgi:TorA maturation chaperone TorD
MRDRAGTLRELIRFYNFFGFRTVEGSMPDHLSVELEFMSRLSSGEVTDPGSALRAQRDFIRKHLGWLRLAAQRSERAQPAPFYRSLVEVTERFIKADGRFVQDAAAGAFHG